MGIAEVTMRQTQEGISEMQPCHTPAALSAAFDEPNLIASAGLVPAVALADRFGSRDLVDQWVTVPGSTGCAGAKVMSLVAGIRRRGAHVIEHHAHPAVSTRSPPGP